MALWCAVLVYAEATKAPEVSPHLQVMVDENSSAELPFPESDEIASEESEPVLALAVDTLRESSAKPSASPVAKRTPAPSKKSVISLGSVQLNRATSAELQQISGVGPVLASRIVAERERCGGFLAVKDLLRVQGIGEKKLELITPYVTVE